MIEQIQGLVKILSNNEYSWILKHLEKDLVKFQDTIRQDQLWDHLIIHSIFKNLLGIGEGSTPQSDDVFLGIIATMNSKEQVFHKKFLRLATFPFDKVTSRKSSTLIRSFLRKNYPKELYAFIELLNQKELSSSQLLKYNREIQRIKLLGASSGIFFLVGVLWQLNYYQNKLKPGR